MNREVITKVRDAVAAEAEIGFVIGFDMSTWGLVPDYEYSWLGEDDDEPAEIPCGTTACIAGYTAAITDGYDIGNGWQIVADRFGIGTDEAYAICIPEESGAFAGNKPAVAMLDWLLTFANCPTAEQIKAKWCDIVNGKTNA